MPEDSEKLKALVASKERLKKRIEELETELDDEKALLEMLDAVLLEKGFKHARIDKEQPKTETATHRTHFESAKPPIEATSPSENVIPLYAATGELLAIVHVSDSLLKVLPAQDMNFSANTPPFTQFLVERVLAKMQERDNELVRAGQLLPEAVFSYSITREGDLIREIVMKNVDDDRVRELKSSIRWTLEKMYEKMKTEA